MGSAGKRKTTMAKLMRESRMRERRMDKEARKQARREAPAEDWLGDALDPATGEPRVPNAAPPDADEKSEVQP